MSESCAISRALRCALFEPPADEPLRELSLRAEACASEEDPPRRMLPRSEGQRHGKRDACPTKVGVGGGGGKTRIEADAPHRLEGTKWHDSGMGAPWMLRLQEAAQHGECPRREGTLQPTRCDASLRRNLARSERPYRCCFGAEKWCFRLLEPTCAALPDASGEGPGVTTGKRRECPRRQWHYKKMTL